MKGLAAIVLLAALACSSAAWGKEPPLPIDSIEPTVAERGQLVSIAGEGITKRVQIAVGGVAADVVSAKNGHATFRVPELAPAGDVLVEARQPGGRRGTIGLRIGFDGTVAAVVDEAAAVSEPIGSEGGTIGVDGMTLSIPAGAVPEGMTITATPLTALHGSPFSADPVGLKLEPSGLVLMRPATLTLPKPAGSGLLTGFGFDGDGEDFHLVPHRIAGDTVQLKVWHFSGAGVLPARLSELATALSYEPSPAHMLAEQRIATALLDAEVNGTDPGAAIAAALRDWRLRSVLTGLQVAEETTEIAFFELAFGEWLAWAAYLQEYRDSLSPADTAFFDTAAALDRDVATVSAAAVARRALDRCEGPALPLPAIRTVIRIAVPVNLADLPIEATEPEPAGTRRLPTGRNLATACVDVEIGATSHAPVLARNRENGFIAGARVVFWSGDPSTSIDLRYELGDTTDGPPVPLASGTASGGFSTTITPSALGLRDFELKVELVGDDDLRTFFDERTLTIPVRERLDLQARRAGGAAFTDLIPAVAPGESVSLRVRLAGDDRSGKEIEFGHDGGGTVPATATTDASGEAIVTYVAPPTSEIELVTATITEGGLTSGDAVVITTTTPVTVEISPAAATVAPGATGDFTATVTGSFLGVTWSATGGAMVATGSTTARYEAGSTPGTFSVTATSIADPAKSATAVVTITEIRRGVTRLADTFGRIHTFAGIPESRCVITLFSTATSWDDSASCRPPGGSSDAALEFAETYAGSELVEVVADGEAFAAGEARGESGYSLKFEVTRPTDVTIDADVERGSCETRVVLISASQFFVFDLDGGAVAERFRLAPGTYQAGAGIVCSGDQGIARFTLTLRFG